MAAPAPVNQFDVARKRAAQQETAALQGQNDAIKRRMASMGGGPSGAMVKLEGQARDESAKRLASANEGIDVQEHAENRRVAEIKEARDFTRGEREASQTWQGGQADLQRRFMTGEREASQLFGRGEREASQAWQSAESKLGRDQQQSQFDKTMNFNAQRAYMDDFYKGQTIRMQQEQFDKNFKMASEQFDHQKYIDQKNLDLAGRIQRHNEGDPGFFGSIFKGGDGRRGGFLGIG